MNISSEIYQDLSTPPEALTPEGILNWLDGSIMALMDEIEHSDVWLKLTDRNTPDELARDILQEIYLEIAMYQPEAIEGAVKAIAQFPRTMPVAWWDEMLHHQVEEFDHGEMALRDYVGFGGSESFARNRFQSPSAFAVAAVWNHFANKRDPWMYLGAVYLFEALTPLITQRAGAALAGRKLSPNGLEFITHHATADIEHARQIKSLIIDVLSVFPDKKTSLIYGFEYFKHVYPMPCWRAAMARALKRDNASAIAAE